MSLKWKIMALLGLIFVTLTLLLISWAYLSQVNRLKHERDLVHARYLVQFKAMLADFSLKTSQVSSLVATMVSVDGALATKDGSSLKWLGPRVSSALASLQLDYGLESIRIYDQYQHTLAEWAGPRQKNALEDKQVAEAILQESSLAWIDCTEVCLQYAATPMLTNGEVSGAVVVASSMADLILSFNRFSGADVGFVLKKETSQHQNDLPKLGLRIAGLSNANVNLPLLQQVESIPSVKEASAWQRLALADKYYDVVFFPIAHKLVDVPGMVVVIENVTSQVLETKEATLQRIRFGLIFAVFTLLAIYFLLNTRLKRITDAVKAIPFLGQRQFEAVRTQIKIRENPVLIDEVDQLAEAALQLTDRLQLLEKDASLHQAEILEMLGRITQANEFSERILDTAQVVIVTQDADGKVTSINHYGEQLLGWDERNLQGKSLINALDKPEARGQLHQVYQGILSNSIDYHYHECAVLCNHDVKREIAWHHSRMDGEHVQILSVGVDITLRKRSEEKSLYLAEHDQLTGLINRQRFMQEVEAALVRLDGTTACDALLYLDLDGFKYINDISGHTAGDMVLRTVADILSNICGPQDVLARLGGDEMGILMRDCDLPRAIKLAEEINRQLGEIKYPGLAGDHHITASIGIVAVSANNHDAKRLLANADIAMYQAKLTGSARLHVFSEGEHLQQKLEQKVLWEDRIKQALREQSFIMQYQPILDIHQNVISHYEALVRMVDENGEMVPPGEFIEFAERSGLIKQIDHYVVRTVIKRWAELLAEGKDRKVAINLSGHSMNDENMLTLLQSLFLQHPELPSHIIFEITETAAVADFATAQTFIETIRALGCAFSLDDFGVGFSSFYYVKHFPVDYVKIDGSFIRNLADSPDDQIFVRALTEVARGFGKHTVAEFVGDQRCLTLLRSYGVDYAQGYFIGKPANEIV